MTDLYEVASRRYYVNQFRDAYKQATMDVVTGQPLSEELLLVETESSTQQEASNEEESAEHVKGLIEDCKKLLLPNPDEVAGAWGLIDGDPVSGEIRAFKGTIRDCLYRGSASD